jgi:hypothetical protein
MDSLWELLDMPLYTHTLICLAGMNLPHIEWLLLLVYFEKSVSKNYLKPNVDMKKIRCSRMLRYKNSWPTQG